MYKNLQNEHINVHVNIFKIFFFQNFAVTVLITVNFCVVSITKTLKEIKTVVFL